MSDRAATNAQNAGTPSADGTRSAGAPRTSQPPKPLAASRTNPSPPALMSPSSSPKHPTQSPVFVTLPHTGCATSSAPEPMRASTSMFERDSASSSIAAPHKVDWFTKSELRRVGTAATMIVVCGTVIILAVTMTIGHYNSLAHSGPKAVLDGAVIALMIGQRGRWRCLALLGVVYGLVLLLQVGVFYLVPVMAVAGGLAAITGWTLQRLGLRAAFLTGWGLQRLGLRAASVTRWGLARLGSRTAAIVVAAAMYEVLAGCGMPLKIYFGTDGHAGAVLWGMWLAELPLRAVGACVGVALAHRWIARREGEFAFPEGATLASPGLLSETKVLGTEEGDTSIAPTESTRISTPDATPQDDNRALGAARSQPRPTRPPRRGPMAIGLRVLASVIACIFPMTVNSWWALSAIAAGYLIYALAVGLRGKLLAAAGGLLWSWLVFSLCSYLWNRDVALVIDLLRTLVLRFAPLTFASTVLVTTVRPVDLIRFLRTIGAPRMVIIPLAQVGRSIPHARRLIRQSAQTLHRPDGTKRFAPISRLRAFTSMVLFPLVGAWSRELHAADTRTLEE
jgi:hypothetical protein